MSTSRKWKPILWKGVLFLIFAFAGAEFGYYAGKLMKQSGAKFALRGWHMMLVPLLIWLVIAWHEFGHVVGGWRSGFQLTLFVVGPLKLERVHDALRLRFNSKLGLWGGVAATAPIGGKTGTEQMKRALLRIVAGGPLFSLMGALLLLPAYFLIQPSPRSAVLLGITGALSLLITLATMIPLSSGGFRSDGARVLQLLKGGEAADRWANLGILAGMTYTIRPRDWPKDLVIAATKPGERSFDAVSGAWLRSCHHEDSGELSEARHWIDEALAAKEEWPKVAQPILHATAAYIYAVQEEPALARDQYELSNKGGFLPKEHMLYAEAAVLLAEGNKEAAREVALKALAHIPAGSAGTTAAQREDMEEIVAKATA